VLDKFYEEKFDEIKISCGYSPEAARVVRFLKEKGYRVALATNPIFPSAATEKRIGWAGLSPSDFELYTTYENSRYAKPSLEYYRDILNKLSVRAEDCLMVGNDVSEDMVAAKLGMKVFLLTECLINKTGEDISAYRHGDFAELVSVLTE
jgi:FMN phosphatase YigB (HAD superfamily)